MRGEFASQDESMALASKCGVVGIADLIVFPLDDRPPSTRRRELRCIAEALPESRQTLLFSATMTCNLEALESLALTNPIKYDLTKKVGGSGVLWCVKCFFGA